MIAHSFHGIHTSRMQLQAKSVTYVSGRSLRKGIAFDPKLSSVGFRIVASLLDKIHKVSRSHPIGL
jgi:hypothetical protein